MALTYDKIKYVRRDLKLLQVVLTVNLDDIKTTKKYRFARMLSCTSVLFLGFFFLLFEKTSTVC